MTRRLFPAALVVAGLAALVVLEAVAGPAPLG